MHVVNDIKYHMLMICKSLGIRRIFPSESGYTSLSYARVLQIAGLDSLQVKIDVRTLKFAGHVARMGPDRDPTRLLFNTAAPTHAHSYTATVSRAALRAAIPGSWQRTAQIRAIWKRSVNKYVSQSRTGGH